MVCLKPQILVFESWFWQCLKSLFSALRQSRFAFLKRFRRTSAWITWVFMLPEYCKSYVQLWADAVLGYYGRKDACWHSTINLFVLVHSFGLSITQFNQNKRLPHRSHFNFELFTLSHAKCLQSSMHMLSWSPKALVFEEFLLPAIVWLYRYYDLTCESAKRYGYGGACFQFHQWAINATVEICKRKVRVYLENLYSHAKYLWSSCARCELVAEQLSERNLSFNCS